YLALMSLLGFAPESMRPTALVLNIFVSFLAFYQYHKRSKINWKLFLLLIVASVPAAYFGGMLNLESKIYRPILGALLILPIIRLIGFYKPEEKILKPFSIPLVLAIGAGIGFLSGLIGIGGGIILSPVILLLGWADLKGTAAISALFITVNSIAGLAGNILQLEALDSSIWLLTGLAIIGGGLGAFLGAHKLNLASLKWLLALVLVIASAKLLFV
ncbi:MAG: sulfite exporter TauE/SafE family protein, partial [Bacteroidia bacterium]|nr:sulfite exporter TauE/SafE family protein [Bacteroidia bacterium]